MSAYTDAIEELLSHCAVSVWAPLGPRLNSPHSVYVVCFLNDEAFEAPKGFCAHYVCRLPIKTYPRFRLDRVAILWLA